MTTTVVVGHGKSTEGRCWGWWIDQADVVVRMWDFHWARPADHGRKYDYGYVEMNPQSYARFLLHNRGTPQISWVAGYSGWRGDRAVMAEHSLRFPTSIFVDHRPFERRGMALGGIGTKGKLNLTRGTIAACWAIVRADPGDEIVLCGFDNVRLGYCLPLRDAFSQAYLQAEGVLPSNRYVDGAVRVLNHDFSVERTLLEGLAAERSVKLSFAQDVLW